MFGEETKGSCARRAIVPLVMAAMVALIGMAGVAFAVGETDDVQIEVLEQRSEEHGEHGIENRAADVGIRGAAKSSVEGTGSEGLEVVDEGDDVSEIGSVDIDSIAVVSQSEGGSEVALEAQAAAAHVSYRTHVQSYGWQGLVRDGEVAGTSGRAKRLEGIELKLTGAPYPGGITYRTHVQGIGWQGWVADGQTSGTSGQARRLEAIRIRLTGRMASNYDVWYRVHAQTFGWMGWARNGDPAGTEGWAKRLEAIEVLVLKKTDPAPGSTANAYNKYVGKPYKVKYDLTHLKNGGTYVFEGGDGYIGGGIYVPGTIAEYRTYFGSRGSINVPSKFYAGIGKEWLSYGIIPGTGLQIEYIGIKDERKAEAISIKGRLGDLISGLPNKRLSLRDLASGLRSLGGEIDATPLIPNVRQRNSYLKCGLCYLNEKYMEIYYAEKGARMARVLRIESAPNGMVSPNTIGCISIDNYIVYM